MMVNKKLQVWLPLLFSIVLIAGMFLGYRMNTGGSNTKNFFSSTKRSPLQEALDLIRLKYVDAIQIDTLEGKAIEEMMSALDPHSVYLPPVDLKNANEDLAGNFQGIGVEFSIYSDTVNVLHVIAGGPGEKAGLRIGDRIIRVNDSILAGKGYNTEEIKKFIRGPGGTKAILQIIRNNQPLTITVTRGTIPIPSVEAAYMIDKSTGYIRLSKFTESSYEEFMAAMEALKKKGLQNLVFDLRGNGGGFMNEAVDMADEFLDGDKLVVYTQGVNTKKREYRCKRPGLFETGKLVILVDELSASASEVLAGSMQDWCRAKVIGRRTFGKGLVQEQYSLSDGSAIRLTVARYYTPLGRSIQRSYAKGKKVYMDELWERYSSGEMFSSDSLKNHRNGKNFVNICNDTLYAGEAITPDIFVPIDTTLYREKINRMLSGTQLSNYIYNYYLQYAETINRYPSAASFASDFSASGLWDGFVLKAAADSININQISSRQKDMLLLRMKGILARYKWRNQGYYEVINTDDLVIKKALETISK